MLLSKYCKALKLECDLPEQNIENFCTKQKYLKPNSIYFAINNVMGFDGYNVNYDKMKALNCIAISDKQIKDLPCIIVDNVVKTLYKTAKMVRLRYPNLKTVTVSGSIGKTTQKEMIYSVLNVNAPTARSSITRNNTLELSRVIFDLTSDVQFLVQELGLRAPTRPFRYASWILQPDAAIITNIGHSHIENFESKEQILEHKLSMTLSMKPDGVLFLNGDDELLYNSKYKFKTVFFGIKNEKCDYVACDIKKSNDNIKFKIREQNGNVSNEIKINTPGEHNILNAMGAYAIAKHFGVPESDIIKGLAEFKTEGLKEENWINVDDSRGYSCLTIAGDTYWGEWYSDQRKVSGKEDALLKYGYDYSFEKIDALFSHKDYNIVNFEAVLTNKKESMYTNKLPFVLYANPENTIKELKHRNINAVILGNNHCSDFGTEIGLQSYNTFKENGIETIGYGENIEEAHKPLLLNCAGKEVIVFSGYWFKKWRTPYNHYATEDMAGSATITDKIFEEIIAYRKKYPEAYIIMSPHWGGDFAYPNEEQRLLANKLIELGVDCIIGHGPHIITDYEWINDKFVLYSIGNCVFNHNCVEFVKRNIPPYGYITKLYINKEMVSLRMYPIDVYNPRTFWQPCSVTDEQFEDIMRTYDIASERVKRDEFGIYIDVNLYPFNRDKKWEKANIKKMGNDISKKVKYPIVYYGLTDKLKGNIDKYIKMIGAPDVLSTKDSEIANYKGKLFLDKYEVISIDDVVSRYPNAEVWVTYAKADISAKMLLKKFAPEKIHFLRADLEYRKGCPYLGKMIYYNNNQIFPCVFTNKSYDISPNLSIDKKVGTWEQCTANIMNDIRESKPSMCDECPNFKYGFWHKEIAPDTIILGESDNCEGLSLSNTYFEWYQLLKYFSQIPKFQNQNFKVKIQNKLSTDCEYCNEILNILKESSWNISHHTDSNADNDALPQKLKNAKLTIIEAYDHKIGISWYSDATVDGWDIFKNSEIFYNTDNPLEHIAIFDYSEDEFYIKGYRYVGPNKQYVVESTSAHVSNNRNYQPTEYKLSVIVPAYNAETFLSRTILTILASTIDDMEIIIVDDGSSDNTDVIIQWYCDKYSGCVKGIFKENSGAGDSRNRGAKIAQGKYIAFVDSDDMIRPDFYQKMYDAIECTKADIATAPFYKIEGPSKYILRQKFSYQEMIPIDVEVYLAKFYNSDWNSGVWNKLYKTELVKEHPFPAIQYEDVAWTPYIFSWANTFCYIAAPVGYEWDRTIRPETISNELEKLNVQDRFQHRYNSVIFYVKNGNPKLKDVLSYHMAVRLYKQGRNLNKGKNLYMDAIKEIKDLLVNNKYVNDSNQPYGKEILKVLEE